MIIEYKYQENTEVYEITEVSTTNQATEEFDTGVIANPDLNTCFSLKNYQITAIGVCLLELQQQQQHCVNTEVLFCHTFYDKVH